VVILSGDTPLLSTSTIASVAAARKAPGSLAFATMNLENPEGYGRVVHAPGKGPALIVEEKDATPEEREIKEVNAGLYVADADFLWSTLSRVDSRNAQREFYLTDLVALAADGPGAVAVRVPPVEASGVNDQEDLSLAIRALTRRLTQALMEGGVTIEDPERFDVDEGVTVGPDTVIEPGVRLRGTTRVGPGCVVGQGSILVDTVVDADVTILPYCHLREARLGCARGPTWAPRPTWATSWS
jgi:bifunctional UDP-N-acetylglucosamine pyrophosphorylase/glucosamine-1-phosphate N-acetyltransferase